MRKDQIKKIRLVYKKEYFYFFNLIFILKMHLNKIKNHFLVLQHK